MFHQAPYLIHPLCVLLCSCMSYDVFISSSLMLGVCTHTHTHARTHIYGVTGPLAYWIYRSPMARETRVHSQVESYQRLKNGT